VIVSSIREFEIIFSESGLVIKNTYDDWIAFRNIFFTQPKKATVSVGRACHDSYCKRRDLAASSSLLGTLPPPEAPSKSWLISSDWFILGEANRRASYCEQY
jgi:hypothetical protein